MAVRPQRTKVKTAAIQSRMPAIEMRNVRFASCSGEYAFAIERLAAYFCAVWLGSVMMYATTSSIA